MGDSIFEEKPKASGGITEQGVYERKATNDDNWYDVIIRDNTPPVITVVDADSSIVNEVILTSTR